MLPRIADPKRMIRTKHSPAFGVLGKRFSVTKDEKKKDPPCSNPRHRRSSPTHNISEIKPVQTDQPILLPVSTHKSTQKASFVRKNSKKSVKGSVKCVVNRLKRNIRKKIVSRDQKFVKLYIVMNHIYLTFDHPDQPSVNLKLVVNKSEGRVTLTRSFNKGNTLEEYEVLHYFDQIYFNKIESEHSKPKSLKLSDLIYRIYQSYLFMISQRKPKSVSSLGPSKSQILKIRSGMEKSKKKITNQLKTSIYSKTRNNEQTTSDEVLNLFDPNNTNLFLQDPPVFKTNKVWLELLSFCSPKTLLKEVSLVSRYFFVIIQKSKSLLKLSISPFSSYLRKRFRKKRRIASLLNERLRNFGKAHSALSLISSKSCPDQNICGFVCENLKRPSLVWTVSNDEIFILDLTNQRIKRYTNVGNYSFFFQPYFELLMYHKKNQVYVFSKNRLYHQIKVTDKIIPNSLIRHQPVLDLSFEVSRKYLFIRKGNVIEIWKRKRFKKNVNSSNHNNNNNNNGTKQRTIPKREQKIQEITMIDRAFVSMKVISSKQNNNDEKLYLLNKNMYMTHHGNSSSTLIQRTENEVYNLSIYQIMKDKLQFLLSITNPSYFEPCWISEEEMIWFDDSIKVYKVCEHPPFLKIHYDLKRLTEFRNWNAVHYFENPNHHYTDNNESPRRKKKKKKKKRGDVLRKVLLYKLGNEEDMLYGLVNRDEVFFWNCGSDKLCHRVQVRDIISKKKKKREKVGKDVVLVDNEGRLMMREEEEEEEIDMESWDVSGITVVNGNSCLVLVRERFEDLENSLYSCLKFE